MKKVYRYFIPVIIIAFLVSPSLESLYSANAQIILPPGSPTNLVATAVSSSQINLSWTAPSGLGSLMLSGYKIERSNDGGTTWNTIVANTGSTATTYSDTGLTASTTYTYRVSAINSAGTSSPSNTASATTQAPPATVPQPPTGLAATSGISQVSLSWAAPSSNGGSAITGYKIYRGTTSGGEGTTPIATVSGSTLSYTDTGLTNGQTYYYTVTAVNSVGGSAPSNEANATPAATAPQPPTGLTATAVSSSQINLSWTAPSNNGGSAITGYKIERSNNTGTTWSTIVSNTASTSTTYSDTGLTISTTYTYRVSAINSVGTSSPSSTASATTSSGTTSTAPGSPTGLTATSVSSSQINLSWTAPSNNGGSAITGYMIEQSTNGGSTWSTIVSNTGSTATTYSNTGLTASTTYTYRVSTINSVGTSSPSSTASATTSSGSTTSSIVLNGVQSTSATVSSSPYTITLSSFNAGTGSNQLLVVGVSANNAAVTSVTFGGTALTQEVSSFNNNDAEFWYLKNPTGTGNIVVTMSGSTSAVVGAYSFSGVDQTTPIPTSATNHNTAASSPTISITTKNANSWVLDLPAIYGGQTLGSPTCTQEWDINVPNAITGTSSSTLAQSAGSVTCKWTANSGGDMWDDVAIEIKASGNTTSTAPGAPTGLAATAGNSQASLSWSAPSSNGGSAITGYNIYRGVASGGEGTTPIATVSGSTLSYTDTGLTNGQTYYYKVTAVNSVGESLQSNEASATPAGSATAPPPPTGLTATAISSSQINLSWTAPANNGGSAITGYEVERSKSDLSFGSFSNSTSDTFFSAPNATTFSDVGLDASTTYNYTVFAKNSVGPSKPSNTASATTQSTTTGTHISLDTNSANIGTSIRVTGTGFTPNSQITVSYDNYQYVFNATNDAPSTSTILSDSDGNFVAIVQIEHSVAGQHIITAQDASNKTATAPITIMPHVFMYPASGHAGSQVLIPDSQGNGFASSSPIAVTFDGQAANTTSSISTDQTGDFGGTFTVPSSASTGQHTVTFSDNKGNTVSLPFNVTSPAIPMYSLQVVVNGLNEPDRMAFIPDNGPGVDGSGAFMVNEKNTGNVWVFKNTNSGFVKQPVPFVTVPNLQTGAEDNGLLGIVIDPNWASSTNPSKMVYLYVTRTVNGAVTGEVIRYSATTDSSGNIVADTGVGEQDILNIPNWQDGHNGGCLRFDSAGNLYITVSDGWQFSVNSQSLSSLQGKVLRITPLAAPSNGQLYSIPTTNPYASSSDPNIRKEIWGYGARNAYSFDVDWKTGKVYTSMVGYNSWEVIENFTTGGNNAGWAHYESPPYGNPNNLANYAPPIYWYPHEGIESNTAQPEGNEAIIGGVFYHGTYYPNLDGAYFFADYGVHFIAALLPSSTAPPQTDPASQVPKSQVATVYYDTSIIPDDLQVWNGQVYMVDLRGSVYVLNYGTPNLSNQGCTTTDCPTGLVATTVSSSQINLSWNAPSGVGDVPIGYKIERATGSENWVTLVSNTGSTTTTYDDTGLAPSTIYTYRVSAIYSTTTSQPSNTASATTLCGPCTLAVSSQISTGEYVSGYYTYLLNSTGSVTQSGYTPYTFTLNRGSQYSIGVEGYDTFVFDHWLDNNSTQDPRAISITSNTQLTAILRDSQPLTLSPSEGTAGTVVTANENHVFFHSNPITIQYDGTVISTTPSTIDANSTGGFTATFTVPAGSIGPHEVSATNGTSTHYAQFKDTPGTA